VGVQRYTAKAIYAAELVDVSTDTRTKSMAKQIKSMKSAADGSKTATEAYAKLQTPLRFQ